jgi:hypothetical protein
LAALGVVCPSLPPDLLSLRQGIDDVKLLSSISRLRKLKDRRNGFEFLADAADMDEPPEMV